MSVGWGVLRNFHAHAKEMGTSSPSEPLFFLMSPGSMIHVPDSYSITHPGPDIELHHEVEFVVRIGPDRNAVECGVGIDLTNRSAQAEAKSLGLPWTDAKSFPSSGPFSTLIPYKPSPFEILLEVNGEVRQRENITNMVHDVETLLYALHSRFAPEVGDLIFTGSPSGVAPLFPGDKLEASLLNNDTIVTSFKIEILGSENH